MAWDALQACTEELGFKLLSILNAEYRFEMLNTWDLSSIS